MRKQLNDIKDDEIREIYSEGTSKSKFPFVGIALAIAAIAILIVGGYLFFHKDTEDKLQEDAIIEESTIIENNASTPKECGKGEIIAYDTVCNNIPLQVIVPINLQPRLIIGDISPENDSIKLATRAADIREDNGEVVSACVIDGEVISLGIAKKGFCAIINNTIMIGCDEATSLFDESIECKGYFFRQYALIDNGEPISNRSKFKSNRIALCQIDNQTAIIKTSESVSLNTFADALVAFGCKNAISLNGGNAYGWYTDKNGTHNIYGNKFNSDHVTYIAWFEK